MRNASDTNVAVRTLALVSLGIWNSIQYNNLQPEPANETAVVGELSHLSMLAFSFSHELQPHSPSGLKFRAAVLLLSKPQHLSTV